MPAISLYAYGLHGRKGLKHYPPHLQRVDREPPHTSPHLQWVDREPPHEALVHQRAHVDPGVVLEEQRGAVPPGSLHQDLGPARVELEVRGDVVHLDGGGGVGRSRSEFREVKVKPQENISN